MCRVFAERAIFVFVAKEPCARAQTAQGRRVDVSQCVDAQQAHIDETTTAFVYRAQSQAVVDADCAPGNPESRARLEVVVVTNLMNDSSSEPPDGDGSSADPENSENSENPERSESPSDAPDGQADEEDME